MEWEIIVVKVKVLNIKMLFLLIRFGPVLVKNPWYTQSLIETAMQKKGYKENKVLDYTLERKSFECIKKFIEEKEKI